MRARAQEASMPKTVPDLWRAKEDAPRLYSLYFIRLQINRLHQRVVSACRQVRRYAARGPGPKEGLFTFSFEIDSLCDLKDYKGAWRQLRLFEEMAHGERFDHARREWSARDAWELTFYHAPLLFFLGRYRQGCALLETALDFHFRRRRAQSYDVLYHVYNGDEEPTDRCGVALSDFYSRLGKRLTEWPQWQAFVNGFHPKLFRLAGARRSELLASAEKLPAFVDRLGAVLAERTTSGVTRGLADLIEAPAKVRKWQEATRKALDEFNQRSQPRRAVLDTKLRHFFPELEGLPR
jgi:hypothetical protein